MAAAFREIPALVDGTARLGSVSLDRLWVKPGRHVHAYLTISSRSTISEVLRNT